MSELLSFIVFIILPTIFAVLVLFIKWKYPVLADAIHVLSKWYESKSQNLKSRRWYRWYKGGLWIQFNEKDWHQCSWIQDVPSLPSGYIRNHYTGGSFHRTLSNISRIEDYDSGEMYEPDQDNMDGT